jgi:serine/threonine-protein kinase
LTDAGFKYSISYNYSDTVEQGVVISQTPGANASGKKGDTIALVVSRGKEQVNVPDLSGKTKDEAVAALQSAGLNAGNIATENHDSVEEGRVISQEVAAGQTVDKGTSVNFKVSAGKASKTYTFTRAYSLADFNKDGHTAESVSINVVPDGSDTPIASGSLNASAQSVTVNGKTQSKNAINATITYKVTFKQEKKVNPETNAEEPVDVPPSTWTETVALTPSN